MRLYLAGPMRGRPHFNFPAFETATKLLRDAGYEVWSPAERDLSIGFNPLGMTGREDLAEKGFSLRDALGDDLHVVCSWAEGLAMLPDWALSSGAVAEAHTANALSLPIKHVGDWLELAVEAA